MQNKYIALYSYDYDDAYSGAGETPEKALQNLQDNYECLVGDDINMEEVTVYEVVQYGTVKVNYNFDFVPVSAL